MYTLVIVDDEPAIREGMASLIDWEDIGFHVAGTARNGEEGLRLHQELAPDLMLVDIRMPRKNGLELIEEIRLRDSHCRFLILSGHADFVYAQQAIRFGIEGYMLKPVNEEELEDYARRIADSLHAEKSPDGGGLQAREEALAELLAGAPGDERALAALVNGDDARLERQGAVACRMLLAEPEEDGDEPLSERVFRERLAVAVEREGLGVVIDAKPGVGWLLPEAALAPFDARAGAGGAAWVNGASAARGNSRGAERGSGASAARTYSAGAARTYGAGATPANGAGQLAAASSAGKAGGEATGGAAGDSLAAQLLAEAAGGAERFTAAAGTCAADAEAVRASLASARELLRHRFLLEPGRVHVGLPALLGSRAACGQAAEAAEDAAAPRTGGGQAEPPPDGPGTGSPAEPDLAGLALRLSRVIDAGNTSGIGAILEEAASSIAACNSSRAYVTASIAQLLTYALAELETLHEAFSAQEHNGLIAAVYKQAHLPALMKELDRGLQELPQQLGASGAQPVLRRMTDYIERHYDEPLKLETLAEMFNYNSGYLGKLFKSHTGGSFNTYLDRVRIARAIQLLSEGVKVRQAAEKVGYANADYFHAKFKKYTGQSPSTYKKSDSHHS